jgi:hypothetical protein
VVLVPWEGHVIDSDETWSVNGRPMYDSPEGRVLFGEDLPTIRVKA